MENLQDGHTGRTGGDGATSDANGEGGVNAPDTPRPIGLQQQREFIDDLWQQHKLIVETFSSQKEWVEKSTRVINHCEAILASLRALSAKDGYQLVPSEIDRDKHRHVLDVWNDCMMNAETLEMTWPKLVKAITEK